MTIRNAFLVLNDRTKKIKQAGRPLDFTKAGGNMNVRTVIIKGAGKYCDYVPSGVTRHLKLRRPVYDCLFLPYDSYVV